MNDRRPKKKTKIVATIGPASDSEETLRELILAGLDVVRLNFSHSTPDYLQPLLACIRKLSRELEVPIAIMGDLQGPRIRVGEIEGDSVSLKAGHTVILTPKSVMGTAEKISISYKEMAQDVYIGSRLLLDDGDLTFIVEDIRDNGDIHCRVVRGGELSSHRGINLPNLPVSLPALTEKDFADIDFAIEHKFDFLALSFVQSADDVRQLRSYLAQNQGQEVRVIAKIERVNALEEIEAIAEESFGVMVARGDLALEMSIEDVPIAQKKIISVCRQRGTPVITATQMLESMIHSYKPTRAEATDVANAVLDGTDALMLSGETAIGKYPIQVITTMVSIAQRTEEAWISGKLNGPPEVTPPKEVGPTIAYASQVVAKSLEASLIISYTSSGATALRVAGTRPFIPILALSSSEKTRRRLALVWGVESNLTEKISETERMVTVAIEHAQNCGLARSGELVVLTAGTPSHGVSGRTNTIKVRRIAKRDEG